jgi:uncharacterized protein YvpB
MSGLSTQKENHHMDTTLLNVPYVSQKAPGSMGHYNDCGAACMSMTLKAFNLANTLTVDELYNAIDPTGDVGLSAGAMNAKMADIGLKASWKVFPSQAALFEMLQANKPVIALIHYGPLVRNGYTEFKNFVAGHFIVITGMDIAKIFIQDPDRDDGMIVTAVPINVFWEAWGRCDLDGNPSFCGIVPDIAITDLSQPVVNQPVTGRYVLTVNGIYVHAKPSQDSPTVSPNVIFKGEAPNLTVVTITEVEKKYGHRLEGGWVSMDLLKPVGV